MHFGRRGGGDGVRMELVGTEKVRTHTLTVKYSLHASKNGNVMMLKFWTRKRFETKNKQTKNQTNRKLI